jgi:hypothetical protein
MTGAAAQQQSNVITVKAYSKEHAGKMAATLSGYDLSMVQSITMLKEPREAKTCSTDDFPVKGTRKWITVYNIYTYGAKIPIGRNKYEYTNMEFVKGGFDQKVDAVRIAREMAIKHQLPMTVQIAKELEKDSPHVSDVEPKTTVGEFSVTFHD